MKHYSELQKSMTPEQKKRAQELYNEAMKDFEGLEDIISISTNPDDIKHQKKIDLKKWD